MKNNNKKFSKKRDFSFKRETSFKIEEPAEKASISDIKSESEGRKVILTGVVDRILQTGGPTVFYLSDGTGNLALKAFEGAGVRAHPEINEGDIITATARIEEFKDELEGEIQRVKKHTGPEKEIVLKEMAELERKRAEVIPPLFLVKSQILDKLKDRFVKAATDIRLAIIQNKPIIIRHHNDADGYSSGFALEKAILPLIEKQHGYGKSAWEFYTRAPCAAPFYEIEDSIRDTVHSLSAAAKFSNKIPLVIISDNGSSKEDLMGIKQGKIHGMDFIVVDHHIFGEKDVISPEVLVHINPFLVEEDGAKYSAGMLCAELARFINPEVENVEQIAAMAGLADRIKNPEAVDAYIKLAEEKGYSKHMLLDIAGVIDYVSAKLRFMEAREYIEVLFGEPMQKQKELIALLSPHIKNLEEKGLNVAKSAAKHEKIGDITLQLLFVEEIFPRGFYPKPGKCVSILQDYQEKQGTKKLITMGVLGDALTMRATDAANFSVHDLIDFLRDKVPEAFVEGGGHKNAGAITFMPQKQEQVLDLARKFIKSRN